MFSRKILEVFPSLFDMMGSTHPSPSLKKKGIFSADYRWNRNPAPVDMGNIPLFTRFHTCSVVQDCFHQQAGVKLIGANHPHFVTTLCSSHHPLKITLWNPQLVAEKGNLLAIEGLAFCFRYNSLRSTLSPIIMEVENYPDSKENSSSGGPSPLS